MRPEHSPILFFFKKRTKVYQCGDLPYETIVSEVNKQQGFTIKPIPLNIRNCIRLRHGRDAADLPEKDDVSQNMWDKMFPFQRQGVTKILEFHRGRSLLADEMGLGKSLQSLYVVHQYRSEFPLLIMCPSYLRFNWQHELLKWGICSSIQQTQLILKGSTPIDRSKRAIIVSYDLAKKVCAKETFKIIIADECHYLKNRKAKRSKVCIPLLKRARRVLLLSGTPALSRPDELFTQLSAISPNTFQRFTPYAKRYCNARVGPFGWDTSGMSNEVELQVILSYLMIRRLKRNVMTELPPKRREECVITIPDSARLRISPLFESFRECSRLIHTLEGKACRDKVFEQKKIITQLLMLTAEIKIPLIKEYLKNILCPGMQKLILFGHHKVIMDAMSETCEQMGVSFIRIDGSTPQKHRHTLVERFQTEKDMKCAILSLKAAGTGLNLTKCSHILFVELSWNPGDHLQAEDRCHRIGQEAESIYIQYLLANETLDMYMWKTLKRKFSTVNTILNDNNPKGFESETWRLSEQEFYAKHLKKLGIQDGAQHFGRTWFPPVYSKEGHVVGFENICSTTEEMIHTFGTMVSKQFVNEYLFLSPEVCSTYTPSPTGQGGAWINLNEYTGNIDTDFSPDTTYYVVVDGKKCEDEEAIKEYIGEIRCFVNVRRKRKRN